MLRLVSVGLRNASISGGISAENQLFKISPGLLFQQERTLTNERSIYQRKGQTKHYDPKWRALRRLKVVRFKLPNFHEKPMEELTSEEIRSKMRQHGLQPIPQWNERQIELSCTGDVFEPYIPPEGDGKASIISTAGAKQNIVRIEKKSKSMLAARKIRNYDEEFDPYIFATQEALSIYKKMHESMMTGDKYEIGKYVTEKALTDILFNLDLKTLRWKFLETIEPPRVMHIRCTDIITKDNVFGQITCRFHTKQTLAIYDRFGRLMFGNELSPKDVLEYVVFEKHLPDLYGSWRIHGKIIPEWKGTGMELESKVTTALASNPLV